MRCKGSTTAHLKSGFAKPEIECPLRPVTCPESVHLETPCRTHMGRLFVYFGSSNMARNAEGTEGPLIVFTGTCRNFKNTSVSEMYM